VRLEIVLIGRDVSIHAPARGATSWAVLVPTIRQGFNPRPRAGGDGGKHDIPGAVQGFQSTPPRGGRPVGAFLYQCAEGFQSTPPRGGRRSCHHPSRAFNTVSIHAPARGATCARPHEVPRRSGFNPRPRAGGDQTGPQPRRLEGFQSTPPRGGRLPARVMITLLIKFQSTPPRGGRHLSAGFVVSEQ